MTTTTDTAKVIAPKALYLEFHHEVDTNGVIQMLLLPEGFSASGKLVPVTMYRRRLSRYTPRRTWKMISSSMTIATATAAVPGGLPITDKVIDTTLGVVTPVLRSLKNAGWSVFKSPIVVEVTPDDFEAARLAKTPYKVLGRVLKSRAKLGFPKEIISTS